MKKFYSNLKSIFFLTVLLLTTTNAWGESYEVNLANTSTTSYTKANEISLSFTNVSQNGNGFALTNKIAGWLESSAFYDFYEGNVTWSNKKTGYSIKVTKAEATFKTSIYTLAYAVYGRVYAGSESTYTNAMYRKNSTQTISISDNSSGLSSSIAFTTGHNSAGEETYLNKLKLTYTFTANSYDVTLAPNGGTGGNQTISATYDAAMPSKLKNNKSIVAPTRAGYTFLGYFDAQSGGTKYYNANLTSAKNWDKASATTLYAQWQENTYTVTWPTIESGLTYTPGEIVQNHWSGGSAVDGSTAVAGTFTCNEELQPAKNTTGYTVTFTPSNTDKYLPKQGNVKQDVAKADQYITWDLLDGKNPKDQYYEYATGEAFVATSYRLNTTTATGLAITYTSSDNSIATVDGNLLKVHAVNQVVTITATCVDAYGNWNDATPVSKTFKTCGAKPDNFEAVKGENLTYGQFLSESHLTGAVKIGDATVAGELSWVEPNTFPSAGSNQTFDVLFTPDNQEAYGSVTFPVTINVAKANPSFDWKIGTSLRAELQYNNFVSTNNAEASFTITTSSNSLLGVTGTKLTTGSVTDATSGWIRVSLPETDNFNALPQQQLNVTVNPKSNVCLPITTMNSDIYDQTFAGGSDDASWTNEGLLGVGMKYYLAYTIFYTRRTGIQLGDWSEGFTGIDLDENKYSDKYVVLTFNGSPKDITFDVETQYVYVMKTSGIGIGLTFPYPATYTNWYLYESPDGANFTQVGNKFNSSSTEDESSTHISRSLKADTRYVKILYSGNFAGWVKNLQITKRDGYLTTEPTSLTFGTNAHPLQDPQAVTINYGALGSCGQTGAITASVDNPHFYLDETSITDNVGFDYNGEYTVRVRCNEVGQTGTLTFTAFDGKTATVSLTSTTPELTSAGSTIFQTGTEHAAVPGSAYRTNTTIDYTPFFSGTTALMDTLYLYGVSESSAANRLWEYDAIKGYKVPALNVAEGNVYTPCFVYRKNGNKYVYARTCDATNTLNISAPGKKLGFVGYRPASTATTANAIQLNGAAGEQTEIYLSNTEIVANGVTIRQNSSSTTEPFALTLYARGNNILSANGAAVQMHAASQLTIEDSWRSEASGLLALRSATGYPSIDLGGNNGVAINGTQLELHNAANMAIAHMDGTIERTDGIVRINDGTIIGEAKLGMPQNTLIDGGTFNSGDVVCCKSNGKQIHPMNSRGDVISRQTMTVSDLAANYAWYGQAHLTPDGANVYPMLFGENGLCVFNAYDDDKSNKDINWTTAPENTSDAIVIADMEVTDTLEVNSLTIKEDVTVTVTPGAVLIVHDGDSYYENVGNLHVEVGGNVVLGNQADLKVNDFILDAALGDEDDQAMSGQVTNPAQIDVRGKVYFQMDFDPAGKISFGWYDFTVPFPVNINGGLYRINSAADKVMVPGVDFNIMEADEQNRANGGKGWRMINSGALVPGKLYTITLDDDVDHNTVRFEWNGTDGLQNGESYQAIYASGCNPGLSGWNGLGNGMLRHGYIGGTYKMQAYNHTSKAYDLVDDPKTFAVGSAFFIQVAAPVEVNWTAAEATNERPLFAPQRETEEVEEFRLTLRDEQDKKMDVLFCSASEAATDDYVIGADLMKLGTPTESKKAQMWAHKGNWNLCDIEMPMASHKASADLSFFAPKAGNYTLALDQAPQNATLYLTQDGHVIWNLSVSPYELELNQGTTQGFGLRIVADQQTPTDIESVAGENGENGVQKVLIDNHIYLLMPDGAMYSIMGQSAK